MRLLVCEFITGGGLLNDTLPSALAREGECMLQALLGDLGDCAAVTHIDVLRDPRLAPVTGQRVTSIPVNLDFLRSFEQACNSVDAVLPIAPESNQLLQQLTTLVETKGRTLLSSRSDAVMQTTSKRATIDCLADKGLPVVPYVTDAANTPGDGWVIKPDDGVGGEDCHRFHAWPATLPEDMLIQPYIDGIAASLSLLCADGQARLLAVNRQMIELTDAHCHLKGVHVNELLTQLTAAQLQNLQSLADAVAGAIPGLWGFVGIDGIMTADGFRVLEINPRLTTAYCGLRASLQMNPAEWLIALDQSGHLPHVALATATPVEVPL